MLALWGESCSRVCLVSDLWVSVEIRPLQLLRTDDRDQREFLSSLWCSEENWNPGEVIKQDTRVIILSKGWIVLDGLPQEIFERHPEILFLANLKRR
jgi:hypothetical protein